MTLFILIIYLFIILIKCVCLFVLASKNSELRLIIRFESAYGKRQCECKDNTVIKPVRIRIAHNC